jgi:hypothetical protein
MACASPGSALAYHLGLATNQAGLMRRTTKAVERADTAASAAETVGSGGSWLSRLFAGLARWYAERERKELDRYLAQAQNVADLEARMRDLQSGRYWLP